MLNYVEITASWLFANAKGRDAKAFTKGPAFASHPLDEKSIATIRTLAADVVGKS